METDDKSMVSLFLGPDRKVLVKLNVDLYFYFYISGPRALFEYCKVSNKYRT